MTMEPAIKVSQFPSAQNVVLWLQVYMCLELWIGLEFFWDPLWLRMVAKQLVVKWGLFVLLGDKSSNTIQKQSS